MTPQDQPPHNPVPRTPRRRSDTPMRVRIELIVVNDDDAARRLKAIQASALCEALEWFATHPHTPTSASNPETP
jgi:hypothetical protein